MTFMTFASRSIDEVIGQMEWDGGQTTVFWSATVANAALCLLCAMHVYWLRLFLLVGYGILTEGAHKAAENEYDGADLCDGEADLRQAVDAGDDKRN